MFATRPARLAIGADSSLSSTSQRARSCRSTASACRRAGQRRPSTRRACRPTSTCPVGLSTTRRRAEREVNEVVGLELDAEERSRPIAHRTARSASSCSGSRRTTKFVPSHAISASVLPPAGRQRREAHELADLAHDEHFALRALSRQPVVHRAVAAERRQLGARLVEPLDDLRHRQLASVAWRRAALWDEHAVATHRTRKQGSVHAGVIAELALQSHARVAVITRASRCFRDEARSPARRLHRAARSSVTPFAVRSNAKIAKYSSTASAIIGGMFRAHANTSAAVWNCRALGPARGSSERVLRRGRPSRALPASPWHSRTSD